MQLIKGMLQYAKVVPSPNKGGVIKPTAIIVHDTAGSLRKGSSVGWLTNPEAQASAHFVVERDGSVVQLINTNLRAWHAGESELNGVANVNNFSIGIEIVNPGALSPSGASSARAYYGEVFSRKTYGIEELPEQVHLGRRTHPKALWMPYTEAQINATLAICLAIKAAYPITAIAPHWQISPGRKIDTNPLFPLPWLVGRVAGRAELEKGVAVPSGRPIRLWPSFYSNLLSVEGGTFPFVDSVSVEVEGIAEEEEKFIIPSVFLEWHKIKYNKGFAYVLAQHSRKVEFNGPTPVEERKEQTATASVEDLVH